MHRAVPGEQFATPEQQADVAAFGMWVFLATEVLFFGGMLLAYAVYRGGFPEGFAEAGRHTRIVIGTVNTVILLTSSFTMAWAVDLAEKGRGRAVAVLLSVTALFGLAFLFALSATDYMTRNDSHVSVPAPERER
jgi:cytochrome c oxidase subunit 3